MPRPRRPLQVIHPAAAAHSLPVHHPTRKRVSARKRPRPADASLDRTGKHPPLRRSLRVLARTNPQNNNDNDSNLCAQQQQNNQHHPPTSSPCTLEQPPSNNNGNNSNGNNKRNNTSRPAKRQRKAAASLPSPPATRSPPRASSTSSSPPSPSPPPLSLLEQHDIHTNVSTTPPPRPRIPALPFSPGRKVEDEILLASLTHPPCVTSEKNLNNPSKGLLDKREVLVDWLMEVANEFNATPPTLALAVSYLDRVLVSLQFPRGDLQLLAVVCIWIACKIELTEIPSITDTLFICDYLYKKHEVLAMEETVLNQLAFKLTLPTHYNVLGLVGTRVGREIFDIVPFTGLLALLDDKACEFAPGVVAIGCVLAACWVSGADTCKLRSAVGLSLYRKWKDEVEWYALRLFWVWKRLQIRHERDDVSRWLLIKWSDEHEKFGEYEKENDIAVAFHVMQVGREERDEAPKKEGTKEIKGRRFKLPR